MIAREVALNVLIDVLIDKAYSNHALNEQLKKSDLSLQDKAFVTELVYGTLKQQSRLGFYMEPYVRGRLKSWVRVLLLMTMYQLVCLDSVPSHAAISESVEIAKKRGGQFNANLVNGLLREVSRQPLRDISEAGDEASQLAVLSSHPIWLVKLWQKQFGLEQTKKMVTANNERVSVKVRVNTLKTTKQVLQEQLASEGIETSTDTLCDEALRIEKGNVANTEAFSKGLCYIQDEASMLVAAVLNPKKHTTVLDCCAAPGGKTTHLAQWMDNTGSIYAHDIYEHKLKLINENATRLGVTSIKMKLQDATTLHECYEKEQFDYVLVDAPCTGLGVMRRHPEAKFLKTPEDLDGILKIQAAILESIKDLVKVGGRVVYSTCTVNRKENDKMVEQFLQAHPQFERDETMIERVPEVVKSEVVNGTLQLFPGSYDTDGFFIASLRRRH